VLNCLKVVQKGCVVMPGTTGRDYSC